MSRTVHKIGTLKLLSPLLGETIEEQCKRIVGVEISDYWESYVEYMQCECDNYFIHNNSVYKKTNVIEIDGDSDIFTSTENSDGTIGFEIRYYNGGCSEDEALIEALKG